jgi:hypothetical protein
MTAQFVDALRGYEYFLRLRGQASLEEVNDYLVSQNRKPISSRTFTHYLKLLSFGFRSYIPINKFDVFQSLGRVQVVSDRRGYGREVLGVHAEISKNRSLWYEVEIVDRSPVGLGILVDGRLPIRPGAPLWVRMDGYEDIPTVVVWRNHLDDATELGVRATEFISRFAVEEATQDPSRLTGFFRVRYTPAGEVKWQNLHRIVNAIDELLIGASDLLYSLDEVLGTNLVIVNPTISSLAIPKPGEIELHIDVVCAEILSVVFEKLEIWGLRKRKIGPTAGQLEMSLINSRIEVLRNVVNLRQESEAAGLIEAIVDGLELPLKRLFDLSDFPPTLLIEASPERAILTSRVLPAAIELLAGDDPDLDIYIRA